MVGAGKNKKIVRPTASSGTKAMTTPITNSLSQLQTTSSSTTLLNRRSKIKNKDNNKHLTHTNTDAECLSDNAGFLRKALYVIEIHNGFKFFSVPERIACHVVSWVCFATMALSFFVFIQGIMDGMQSDENKILFSQENFHQDGLLGDTATVEAGTEAAAESVILGRQ